MKIFLEAYSEFFQKYTIAQCQPNSMFTKLGKKISITPIVRELSKNTITYRSVSKFTPKTLIIGKI